jgi:flavodoxin
MVILKFSCRHSLNWMINFSADLRFEDAVSKTLRADFSEFFFWYYMKSIVLYTTKSGNTEKIADAIAAELNCESVKIPQTNSPDLSNCDLIFIGTGIRFGNPNEDLTNFLKAADFKETKLFALFLTWGGAGKTDQETIAKLKTLLDENGQKLAGDIFKCYGGRQFTFVRRGHPNEQDAKAAREWAKKIVNESQ